MQTFQLHTYYYSRCTLYSFNQLLSFKRLLFQKKNSLSTVYNTLSVVVILNFKFSKTNAHSYLNLTYVF